MGPILIRRIIYTIISTFYLKKI